MARIVCRDIVRPGAGGWASCAGTARPGSLCRQPAARRAKHPLTKPSIPLRKNIPLYRNSEFGVCVAPSRLIQEGRSSCRHDRGPGCGGRGSVGTRGAGRAGSPCEPETACGRAALSGSSRCNSSARRQAGKLRRQRAVRTAKPCGPGRRCYGQALAEVAAAQPATASSIREAREARRNSAPGRARHKPSNHAQGRPSDSAPPVCCCAVFLRYIFAQRTAGASRHPAFPAPSCMRGWRKAKLGRNAPRGARRRVCDLKCELEE